MEIEEDDFVEKFYQFVVYDPYGTDSEEDSSNLYNDPTKMSETSVPIPIVNKTKKSTPPSSPLSSSPPLRKIRVDFKCEKRKQKLLFENVLPQVPVVHYISQQQTNHEANLHLPSTSSTEQESPWDGVVKARSVASTYSSSNLTNMSLDSSSNSSLDVSENSISCHSTPNRKSWYNSRRHHSFREERNTYHDLPQKKSRYSWNVPQTSAAKRHNSFIQKDKSSIPLYKNHQLIGDSQFVRFTQQIMPNIYHISHTDGCRHIGYCVSGQKIADLYRRLESKRFDIHKNVILLIGTNDIRYGTKYIEMLRSYNSVLNLLKQATEKLVLLTIPPVPKLEHSDVHWDVLQKFNRFISEQEDGVKVFVVDIASLFVTYNNKSSQYFFEQVYYGNNKEDKVHLNNNGFKILKSLLDICYFDK